jgi:hypothetical protein
MDAAETFWTPDSEMETHPVNSRSKGRTLSGSFGFDDLKQPGRGRIASSDTHA